MSIFGLLLLLAGAGLGAQPAARKPLPETAVLDRVDGRLFRADANTPAPTEFCPSGGTWLFELTREVKTRDYALPAGTRFVLLPSATLGQLLADVNDRAAPRYRLSARVTQYRGRNYLLPVYYLPLSKFRDQTPAPDERQPAAGDRASPESAGGPPLPDEPELKIPSEVLEQLQNQPPLRGPRRDTRTRPEPVPATPDRVLVNCVGRIESCRCAVAGAPLPAGSDQRAAVGPWVFVPYALGWNLSDLQYELLPSRALEEALQVRRQALDPIRFNVAGLVTEFRGRKYLLLQRAIVAYNYGNFGR